MRRLTTFTNFGFFIAVAVLAAIAFPNKAFAANETYTWKDYRTITISGGDTARPTDLLLDTKVPLTGDQAAAFAGTFLYKDGCTIHITIYTYKSTPSGYLYAPPGPLPVPPEVRAPGTPISCNATYKNYDLQNTYNGKWITINGTRPQDPNATEQPEQQTFRVLVLASDPQSTAPKTDTVFIYTLDGKTQIMSMVATFTPDKPQLHYPPDQTPMSATITFQGLQPGQYVVCDTYVAKNCSSDKADDSQKITKVKYDGNGSTTIGKLFQTPDEARIRGHIEYHTLAPCGSSVTVSPLEIELTHVATGQKYVQKTQAGQASAPPEQNNAWCQQEVQVGLYATWENMPSGDYTACASLADPPCVTITKKDGEGITDFTLVIHSDPTAPPDQKVCTTGDGIAGALAWILCPVVEAVATATQFFENNIIVPFLTVSPLTTSDKNPIYLLWQNFRDLANVVFIMLLFISIFSIALSKYGMKRVLPRLLVVIIGINLSYFVVAFIIDVFNIFGAGVSQLVVTALTQAHTTQLTGGASATPLQSIFVLGGAALTAILLTGGAALGWLIHFILLAALIILVTVAVLLIRQIAIVTLVVVAPIAIVLSLLPNTEQFFKKWWKLLLQLLMMYPMIVLLFAAGKIFGVFLQQPDFNFSGGEVTGEVSQSIRVILQLVAWVGPLGALPFVFIATGSVMGKVYARAIQSRMKRFGEDTAQLANEAKLRAARSSVLRKTGIGQLAGMGLKRDYVRQSRQRNLQREQEEYVAGAAGGSAWLRRRASGAAGAAGRTRAAASAAGTAAKGRTEDLNAEMALLDQEMRRIGMDQKSFSAAIGDYLRNPNDKSKQIITGSNGQTFDFAANKTRLQRALLNSAASQGEVTAIEAARMSKDVDQTMLDDIIRRNDGELKGNGGYHLATQFDLAHDRIKVRDPTTGAERAPVNDDEVRAEIVAQRLIAMSQSGADSIAGMKAGMIDDSADILRTPGAFRDSVLTAMDTAAAAETTKRRAGNPSANAVDYRASLRTQLNQVLNPRNKETLARSDANEQDFRDILANV